MWMICRTTDRTGDSRFQISRKHSCLLIQKHLPHLLIAVLTFLIFLTDFCINFQFFLCFCKVFSCLIPYNRHCFQFLSQTLFFLTFCFPLRQYFIRIRQFIAFFFPLGFLFLLFRKRSFRFCKILLCGLCCLLIRCNFFFFLPDRIQDFTGFPDFFTDRTVSFYFLIILLALRFFCRFCHFQRFQKLRYFFFPFFQSPDTVCPRRFCFMILVVFFCDFINRTNLPRQLFRTDHLRFLCLISLQFFFCFFHLNKPFQKFFCFCKFLSLTCSDTFCLLICTLCGLKFLLYPVTECF